MIIISKLTHEYNKYLKFMNEYPVLKHEEYFILTNSNPFGTSGVSYHSYYLDFDTWRKRKEQIQKIMKNESNIPSI